MSQITMSSTYESNLWKYYEQIVWVHMSQIDMSSTYESNYYDIWVKL